MTPLAWRALGRTIDTPDGRVFVVELGKDKPGIPVLLLHGFPTSSWDFCEVAVALAEERPVVAFDFLGFGFSDKPARFAYSLFEQADVTERVLRELGVSRVHVVAHDMGTSVTTELLARRERGLLSFRPASVTLSNGSVYIEMASLTFGQRLLRSPLGPLFARLNSRRTFVAQLRRILARPVDEAILEGMWEQVSREDGARRLPAIIGYIAERHRFAARWNTALARLDIPVLVAWGARDPVAILAIGQRLAREIPGARRVIWEDLGHYPQIEDPPRFIRTVSEFLRALSG